jgi:predicted nucleotidyltransferase
LFGSYAYGTPTEESDIDLYVVTNDDFIPRNFKEKSEVHLKIARALQDIVQKYPTDLITHTKSMHEKFKELNSSFAREIISKGIHLL